MTILSQTSIIIEIGDCGKLCKYFTKLSWTFIHSSTMWYDMTRRKTVSHKRLDSRAAENTTWLILPRLSLGSNACSDIYLAIH